MTEQTSARDLFRAAYENRYTWNKDFPGYTTDVTLKRDNEVYEANARIEADFKFEVSAISEEKAKDEIKGQVWEIAVHRVRHPFEETHKHNHFTLGETDETGAVEILVSGKSEGDRYKVRDNVVTLVHRHIHSVVVTINTLDTIDTGEGYLPHRYDSVYHDSKTGAQKGGTQVFEDTYEKIGDYYILTRRLIKTEQDGQVTVSEFIFSNVQLLQPVPA